MTIDEKRKFIISEIDTFFDSLIESEFFDIAEELKLVKEENTITLKLEIMRSNNADIEFAFNNISLYKELIEATCKEDLTTYMEVLHKLSTAYTQHLQINGDAKENKDEFI